MSAFVDKVRSVSRRRTHTNNLRNDIAPSWTANDTRIVRPNRIEWESTSGMKNVGSVEFAPQPQSSSETATQMTLRFTFVTPRVVSSLFRRSGKIRRYTEDVLLKSMLEDFRDVVLEEDL